MPLFGAPAMTHHTSMYQPFYDARRHLAVGHLRYHHVRHSHGELHDECDEQRNFWERQALLFCGGLLVTMYAAKVCYKLKVLPCRCNKYHETNIGRCFNQRGRRWLSFGGRGAWQLHHLAKQRKSEIVGP